jgi:hypothetical protein
MNATTLRSMVWLARRRYGSQFSEPAPGDLVVEATGRRVDPDAIGILDDHGTAPYATGCACGRLFDGSEGSHDGDMRDQFASAVRCGSCGATHPARLVADVRPLSGKGTQRWENARFVAVPRSFTAVRP